jgi:hypothetical protein
VRGGLGWLGVWWCGLRGDLQGGCGPFAEGAGFGRQAELQGVAAAFQAAGGAGVPTGAQGAFDGTGHVGGRIDQGKARCYPTAGRSGGAPGAGKGDFQHGLGPVACSVTARVTVW